MCLFYSYPFHKTIEDTEEGLIKVGDIDDPTDLSASASQSSYGYGYGTKVTFHLITTRIKKCYKYISFCYLISLYFIFSALRCKMLIALLPCMFMVLVRAITKTLTPMYLIMHLQE